MECNPLRRLLFVLVPACLALVACGGGDGDSTAYVSATSSSFSPTTAKDKATKTQDVPLHWVYAVNNGLPVTASFGSLTIGISVGSTEVKLDPASLQRQFVQQGQLSGRSGSTDFSGSYSGMVNDNLMLSAGKTVSTSQSSEVNLSLAGGGESGTGKLNAKTSFTPPYEWFLDRDNLDQLPIGQVQTVTSNGVADFNITVTGEAPIVKSNQPFSTSERWTVLEKLPTMTVRGKSYSNVVKLSRQTRVPDFSGNLTAVTMYYWVSKGVGMIRGEGVYRVLSVDNVVYELVETNLSPL